MRRGTHNVKGESQRNIVKLMRGLEGRYSLWEIWQDFITMSACSIANTVKTPSYEARETMYLQRAQRYSREELEVFAQMLAEVVKSLDKNPDQDYLGELFMELGLGSEWHGQFFTPYSICKIMSMITDNGMTQKTVDEHGWASVCDPACGAGALLIAFANECLRNHLNYQTSVLFVAQDIDRLAACMCYIQLSLLGCPGYVVVDNTLTKPSITHDRKGLLPVDSGNVWYTPMYFRDVWQYRKAFAQMDMLFSKEAG